MDLEIRHLRLVEAIAREGTMTRAGRRLHLTQPALSHQLTDVEARLGVSLFRRTPRGMVLTAAGTRLLACATAVLEELRQTCRQLENGHEPERGTVRLSTECYTCYHWLPARVKRFQQQFPEVEVRIVVEATRRPVEALLAREIDVAVISRPPRRKGLRVRELFEDELVAVASPQNCLAARPYLRPADFAREHLITYALPLPKFSYYRDFLKPAGIVPARISRVELSEAIVEMVKANLGIAVLARWAVAPHLGTALQALRLGRNGLKRKWYAATVSNGREPGYRKAFVELLAEERTPFG